eukprot:1109847-Lingulodinium_polyedra.AAC.1
MPWRVHRAQDVLCVHPAKMLHAGLTGLEAPRSALTTLEAWRAQTPAIMGTAGKSKQNPMATTSPIWRAS